MLKEENKYKKERAGPREIKIKKRKKTKKYK